MGENKTRKKYLTLTRFVGLMVHEHQILNELIIKNITHFVCRLSTLSFGTENA